MSQKVKYRFEFEVSDNWKAGESACWTECPFSPLIRLGNTCEFLTTKESKCQFCDNKFKTLIEKGEGDKMTDNEIIKALECCIRCKNCDICPQNSTDCVSDLIKLAHDLITCQQEDIEKLKIENKSLRSAANSYKLHYNEARAEAVKEFAEKLKFVWFDNRYDSPDIDFDYFVDILVETLAGDTE